MYGMVVQVLKAKSDCLYEILQNISVGSEREFRLRLYSGLAGDIFSPKKNPDYATIVAINLINRGQKCGF